MAVPYCILYTTSEISRYMNCPPYFVTMFVKMYLHVYGNGPVGLILIIIVCFANSKEYFVEFTQ